ncbi:UNVERIFIED_CONTAM: hypothetical protein Sangu_1011400 [Sesamum angustifolium]|uniref:Endonuclease/exonuclease/phosphatase domain-containing protein n=1 Tax=Sesamum angustifolium TaxID=2727405 RepID=A0AAW2PFL7_9LAMI
MMNIGVWNVHGLNRRDHQVVVGDLITDFRLNFLGLLETRSPANVLLVQSNTLHRWNRFPDYSSPVDTLQIISSTFSCICSFTIAYGANDIVTRRELWHELIVLSNSAIDEQWLVLGDFNAIIDMSEVCGYSGDIRQAMDTNLITLPVQGCTFTWHNNNENDRSLWRRLDHMLLNDKWLEGWPNSSYLSLTLRPFDHSPLVLCGSSSPPHVSMFRFDNYLAASPNFIPSVQNILRHQIVGTSMFAVTRKLKALNPMFPEQRTRKGDLDQNVKLAAEFLASAQTVLHLDQHNPLLIKLEYCCRRVYLKAVKLEQCMLQQRAKIQWHKGEDQCTRVFYRKVARRRAAKCIFQITTAEGQTYLTDAEDSQLVTPIIREEVKEAFFDIAEDKSPRPDGYSSRFFKGAWSIIGDEVMKAV